MEPMTLGSPIGTPSSPVSGSAYLPEFLMGEPVHNPHPSSPTKTPRQVNALQGAPRTLNLNNISPALERRSRPLHVNQVEKPLGPPVKGLFDTLESTTVPTASTPTFSNLPNNQPSNMGPTVTQTKYMDDSNSFGNWVTVFGFPPSAASLILSQFSQLGQLLEHRFPPKGNWVHLHYYSKMEARRALTYHGKIIGGTTMIAVMPCKDQNILKPNDCFKTIPESPNSSSLTIGPNPVSPCDLVSPFNNDKSFLQSPRGGARPLNRSFQVDNEVLSQQNTPIRNTGFVSRTFDYIFGW